MFKSMLQDSTSFFSPNHLLAIRAPEWASVADFGARVGAALTICLVLAVLIERFLVWFYEHTWTDFLTNITGFKSSFAYVISFVVCWERGFDAIYMIYPSAPPSFIGVLITAGTICGGSKVVIEMFKRFASGAKEIKTAADDLKS